VTTSLLRVQHTSLQFSDNPRQQRHDVSTLFTEGERNPLKTGTEAGGIGDNKLKDLLIEYAEKHNHVLNFAADTWVAVDRAIIKPRSVEKGDLFLASNDDMVGHGQDRKMAWIEFDHVDNEIGRISQGSVHYATRGRKPGEPNFDINKKCATKIHKWMVEHGKGSALAFVNGDFNMPDRTLDWSLGGNFTSMADELKAWQMTGHGPIDGFASYDHDGRVAAKRFVVLDDKELMMFSDHYYCLGAWEVTHKKA
jgi:hypothetical protein